MPVRIKNYSHSYSVGDRKIFVPNAKCRAVARDVVRSIKSKHTFPDYIYSMKSGGHVAAIHYLKEKTYFCSLDLRKFFYSISRNRVARDLRKIGEPRSEYYARWSTVRNPYIKPQFSVPNGFPQSPYIAALAVSRSKLGVFVAEAQKIGVRAAVFVDDVAFSSDDSEQLTAVLAQACEAAIESGFSISAEKVQLCSAALALFNCKIEMGRAVVDPERKLSFYQTDRSPQSVAGFQRYVRSVEG